jgi:hypothetical protein
MAKLNHSRPQLRYNDNLRRELSKGFEPSEAIASHQRYLSNLVRDSASGPKYVENFEALSHHKRSIANHLLECWRDQVEAFSEYVPTLVGKRNKGKQAALDAAQSRLVEAGAIFMCESLEEFANGEDGVWHWLKSLSRGRDVHFRFLLDDLQETLFNESLPLCTEWAQANYPTLLAAADRLARNVA